MFLASLLFLESLLLLTFILLLTSLHPASMVLASSPAPVVYCTAVSPSVYIILSVVIVNLWSSCCGIPTVVNIPSSTDVSTCSGILAIVGVPCCSTFLLYCYQPFCLCSAFCCKPLWSSRCGVPIVLTSLLLLMFPLVLASLLMLASPSAVPVVSCAEVEPAVVCS